jgi:hypothetical protein
VPSPVLEYLPNKRMLAYKHSLRSHLIVKGLTHGLTALVLACVYLGSLQVSNARQGLASDEVFCPLQRTWVKRGPASFTTKKQREPLKNICASDERKSDFLTEFLERLPLIKIIPGAEETEKLFFAYFAEGKPALANFISSHSTPEPQFISSARTEKSANNTRFEFAKKAVEFIVPGLQPRPPTLAAVNNFTSQTIFELKNISRRIQPRAPPVSI